MTREVALHHSERAAAPPELAGHFEDLDQQRDSATLGMWVFLVTEILFFGGLFAGYAYYRYRYPEGFAEASRLLDLTLGAVNTVVLLGSSLTMAMAVRSAQLARSRTAAWYLLGTIVLGTVFLGIKAIEYAHKFHEHHVPGRYFHFDGPFSGAVELFLSFYFAMTGLHATHMIVGIGLLALFTVWAWRGRYNTGYSAPVEILGLYWHFVDIIWLFLFPLLYLVGHHTVGGGHP